MEITQSTGVATASEKIKETQTNKISSQASNVSISVLASSTSGEKPRFPERPSVLGHIFRKKDNHLEKDTPENRAYILRAVSNPNNRVTITPYGEEIYFKILADGTQAWAQVKQGVIRDGGLNLVPFGRIRKKM